LQCDYVDLIPDFIKKQRTEDELWEFIKLKYNNYADRREFFKKEFNPILETLEFAKEELKKLEILQSAHKWYDEAYGKLSAFSGIEAIDHEKKTFSGFLESTKPRFPTTARSSLTAIFLSVT